MHLFFVDQYISLDMMAPIMFKLSKKNKVYLCNFNKIQSLNDIQLYKFLIKQKNINIISFVDNNFSKNNIFLFFLNCLMLLPSFLLKRGYKYWSHIWKNYNFVSKKNLIKFIRKEDIRTISIDESLYENKRKFLLEISKKLNIPIIINHGGLYTIKTKVKKKEIFNKSYFYLSPSKIPIYTHKLTKDYLKSGQYIQYGSPRFDVEWLNILKRLFKAEIHKKNKNIKLAIFVRPTTVSGPLIQKLLESLKNIKNIEVKINYKPRDVWPTKSSNLNKSEMQSSELIIWSDIVISYASSIILEAICRDKPLIYLNYLQIDKKEDISWFDNFRFIKKGKNLDYTINSIQNFKKNSKQYVIRGKNKKFILKKFITNKTGKEILSKYNFFYKKISQKNF